MDKELLRKDLIRDECRNGVPEAKPYVDSVGKITIGIGHNLTDNGLPGYIIDLIYDNDVTLVRLDLNREFPWWQQMSEPRQRVFANMVFNMGVDKFSEFHKMLYHAERGEYIEAAAEMLDSAWAKQVGPRAQRLAALMRGETNT